MMATFSFVTPETIQALTIRGILDSYNEAAHVCGIDGRQSFRDKPTAIKAYESLRRQYADLLDDLEKEGLDTPENLSVVSNKQSDSAEHQEAGASGGPGYSRLRASGEAESLRQKVVEDQVAAAEVASEGRATTKAEEVVDTTVQTPPVKTKKKPGKRSEIAGTMVITVVAQSNPKTGSAAERFAKYATGMTVNEYAAKIHSYAKAVRDVKWDSKMAYITLSK